MKQAAPTTQLTVKTLLNFVQPFVGFVYRSLRLVDAAGRAPKIEVQVEPRAGSRPRCCHCHALCPGYDRLEERRWMFVPLWGLATEYVYTPRRVMCQVHGVVVEHLPWNAGKQRITTAAMGFLARWARRFSWRETARVFGTSWETVYRSVEWFVEWGLAHRKLDGVEAIGVDEIHWGRGKKGADFLTGIYQIDRHCRRRLWIGPRRTQASLRSGLHVLGPDVIILGLCRRLVVGFACAWLRTAKGIKKKLPQEPTRFSRPPHRPRLRVRLRAGYRYHPFRVAPKLEKISPNDGLFSLDRS